MTKRFFLVLCALVCIGLCGCGISGSVQQNAVQDDLAESLRLAGLGQTPKARQWADRAIAVDPKSQNVYGGPDAQGLTIAYIFTNVGDDPSLALYMQQAHKKFPDLDWPLIYLTQAQDRLGDTAGRQKSAQALVDILNAQLKKPGAFPSADKLSTLAQAYFDAGDAAKGAGTYKRVIDTFPRDTSLATACNNLAYAYAQNNSHLPEALTLVSRALSLTDSNDERQKLTAATYRDTLGWVQYRMGDYKAALSTLQDAANDDPREAELRYHLAMTYKALGQTEAARVEFQHAAQLSTGYAAPQKELALLPPAKPAQPAA